MWGLQGASDWALRRLLKVLLKRNLKGVLETEIDVEQLRVSLGTGALELTDVLLSRQWLAEQAPPGLEIVSGYIGRLRLDLALTSLTCGLTLEDVLITVRPGRGGGSGGDGAGGAGAGAQSTAAVGSGDAPPSGPAGFGIDEGVRLVAAGVETLLQRMTVTVSGLSVRLELGGGDQGGAAATLSCVHLSYGATEQDCPATGTTARRVSFAGLSLGLEAPAQQDGPTPPLLAPLDGEADVVVTWPVHCLPNHQPHVSLAVRLEALQVQLRPADVAGLLVLARRYADAHAQAAAAAAAQQQALGGGASLAAISQQQQQLGLGPGAAGHHSFIADLMLPECEAMVQEALRESTAAAGGGGGGGGGGAGSRGGGGSSTTGQEDVDEFFDAKSLLGSLQQAFSSPMAASSYHSSGDASSAMPGGASSADDSDMFAMHDLAASIREVGGESGQQWSTSVSAPSFTLCLLYPQEAGCSSPHYAPRLVAEVLEVQVQAESASSSPYVPGSSSLSLTAGVLEVSEHLPFPSHPPSPASSVSAASTALNPGGWLPAEEMARVPALLPSAPLMRWPAFTSAGDYPLPDAASSLGFGDTLAQLSDLSQATVYQSATMMESSMMLGQSIACHEASAVPRVQVVPVLVCSGQGAALVVHCGKSAEAAQQGAAGDAAEEAAGAGADVSLMLQPVCVWCTLPLMAHLQAFAASVGQHLASAGPALDVLPPGCMDQERRQMEGEAVNGSTSKAAVAAAISGILQQQQQQQQQQGGLEGNGVPSSEVAASAGGPLRLCIYLPAACLVVAVPTACPGPPSAPKYFAVEAQGSSSQLLASVGPRLGSQRPQALVASLHESGVEPTVVLQQGGGRGDSGSSSSSGSNGSSSGNRDSCLWECTLRTGAVAVHAMGEARGGAERELGDSMLGHSLAPIQVASIAGGASPADGGGLTIRGAWQQPDTVPSSNLLESLSASGDLEPGCQPDPTTLWEQLKASAPLAVSISVGAPLAVWLQRGVVAAAGRLADGVLQLSAAAPPAEAATHTALRFECAVRCTLLHPERPPITLAVRSIRAVICSSIGGLAGSSAAVVAAGSAELTQSCDGSDGSSSSSSSSGGGSPHLLAHAAGQQQEDGRRTPAAQLFALLRPTGEPYVLSSAGRYVVPCRGRATLCTAGLTLLLDESGQLAWAADLQSFFAAPEAEFAGNSGASLAAHVAAAALPPPPALALDWSLALLSSAVRYEPRDTTLTAAVLSAASIRWRARHGQQQGAVEAHRLALHVAASASGGGGGTGTAQRGGLAPALAHVAGFHQVATEAGITVQLPSGEPPAGGQQQAGMQEVVVTNRGLSITLSRHTLLLLQRLMRQLPGRSAATSTKSGASSLPLAVGSQRSPDPECCSSSAGSAGSWHGDQAGAGAGVNVLAGVVQGEYASPRRPAESPLEASVFLDGGWYDPEQAEGEGKGQYVMSPAGSPPAIVDEFLRGSPRAGRPGAAQEGQGIWYSAAASEVQEDYVALQPPTEEEAAASPGSPSYDCRVLPPDHPPPHRRLSLRDISMTITLADTFATVLLPEDSGSSSNDMELHDSPPPVGRRHQQQRGSMGSTSNVGLQNGQGAAGAAAGQDTGAEEVVVPLSALVQARLEGVCVQLDTFAVVAGLAAPSMEEGQEAAPLRTRTALLVRTMEVRDSFQPRQGGGTGGVAAASATAMGWAGLRRMLGYHASVHRVRPTRASMVQLVVEAIQAEPGAELEHRVHVCLLPLLLHMDQAALAFMQHFFAAEDVATGDGNGSNSSNNNGSSANDQAAALEPFFQRCEVQPFTVTIKYHAHRVDLAALSSGQLSEVFNLVPWGGVSLQFRHLRLVGLQGLGGVGTAVASAYVEDIARFQAHRFVSAIAPIASICRVSSAAAQLLAIPRQQLYKRCSGGGGNKLILNSLADEDFRRQMQRGLAGFVRAVALEAINLGATVAAGAEVALAGEASASHTAGMKQALRQASAHLRSSTSGPRTAASAAATAVRTALLGVRNTLDKEHNMERRMNL